jgi:metal-dependent amidase/aminoacylase/carboxypeptidase family protein
MFPVACLLMTTTASSPRLVSDELEASVIAWRRHLHANPELSFEEHETAAFVEQTLRSFGGLEIERPAGTAVVARLHGARPGKVVVLRADMDALPIQEENEVPYVSTRPGVMHACGHDGHTAILLGVAQLLCGRRDELAGEVRFACLDGADLVAGVHLLSTLHTGHVSAEPGSVMAAADLFTLEIFGEGGHGANPHETIDPVVVAAQVITNLQQIVSRETDPFDSVVVSVTTLTAGTARNVIPGSARIGGTVRTLSVARRADVRDAMERVIAGVASAHRAGYRFDYEVGYDPVVNDRDASAAVQRAIVSELGEEALVEVPPVMGGEDFSAYGAVAPAVFFWVGTGNEELETMFPHHHPRFDLDEAALRDGIAVFARTVLDALRS